MADLTEESFQNYKNFLTEVYPRVTNREFKALWEEVEFCSGSVEDFHAMTLIRFLLGKGLKEKIPQCIIDYKQKWEEEKKVYNPNTEEGAKVFWEEFERYSKDAPDTSNVLYEYTIDEDFKIEDIMTREMAIKFFEHYSLDLEYWMK